MYLYWSYLDSRPDQVFPLLLPGLSNSMSRDTFQRFNYMPEVLPPLPPNVNLPTRVIKPFTGAFLAIFIRRCGSSDQWSLAQTENERCSNGKQLTRVGVAQALEYWVITIGLPSAALLRVSCLFLVWNLGRVYVICLSQKDRSSNYNHSRLMYNNTTLACTKISCIRYTHQKHPLVTP